MTLIDERVKIVCNKFKNPTYLILGIACVILLNITQDLWHAHFKNYQFYWYESLLFKSYWLYFLPSIWRINQLNISKNKMKLLFNVFFVSSSQILFATFIIYWIAQLAFYAPFRWQNILNYLFEQHFVETLLIYGATFVFVAFKNRTTTVKQEKPQAKFITVIKDKKRIPIQVEKILFIQTDRPYIAIHTSEQRFLKSTTLKQILTTINHPNFLPIHKSTIINISHVENYISRQNGDYDVEMKDGTLLRLSRTYAKRFKEVIDLTQLS